MKEEKQKIIAENISRLFLQRAGFGSRFLHQAHEAVSLINEEIDVDYARSIMDEAYKSSASNERCDAFIWLGALSEMIYDALGEGAVREHIRSLFSSSDDSVDSRSIGKISYMRNKFTDKAFDKFAKFVNDAKLIYSDSFEDSCTDTYNGICEYCILPTASSSDGKLKAFYRLIEKYDLHVAASTEIRDGDNVTTVSLISRDTDITKLGDDVKGRMLELGLSCDNTSDLGGIISLADSYGMKLAGIDSKNSDDGVFFTLLFSTDHCKARSIETLTFCLSSIYPSFTITGFYKHII